MKKWILILAILIYATACFAEEGEIETYKPRELFDLSVHLTNETGDVDGASCFIQIQNETYQTIIDTMMNGVGKGWYNFTYGINTTGKYYCRFNCTKNDNFAAETCDFIIGVKDNMVLGTLVFIPLFIAAFLLVVSWLLDPEKYWALKLGLIMVGMVFIFQSYQYSNLVISEFFPSDNISNAIGDSTYIYSMIFAAIVGVFMITFIYDIFMIFSSKKKRTGDYNEQ